MVTPKKHVPQFAFGSQGQQSSPTSVTLGDFHALDPDLTVIFKGLQKRDQITRARASDELLDYLRRKESFEVENAQEELIKAWVTFYPSLAIDVNRKVRANAHSILGQLVVHFKRKTARFLQDVAGSWLLGLYDNDRIVSRAAHNALVAAFPSEDKRIEFRRIFHKAIYDRCKELAFDQTPGTLSDSRFTNEEDSEAKFSNVTSAALQVIASMSPETEGGESVCEDVIGEKRFWELLGFEDASIQKAAILLLSSLVEDQSLMENESLLIKHLPIILQKCHPSNVVELVRLLKSISDLKPDLLFTSSDTGKKTIPARLAKLIRSSGGVGTSEDYWHVLRDTLLNATRCKNHSDETLLPLLTALELSTEKATRPQTEAASTALVEICTVYIMAGSTDAQNKLTAFFSRNIRDLRPLKIYTQSLGSFGARCGQPLGQLLAGLQEQVQQSLKTTDIDELPQLEQWVILNRDLARMEALAEVNPMLYIRAAAEDAASQEESNSISFSFLCSVIDLIGYEDLAQSSSFVQSLRQRLSVLRFEAVHLPEKFARLIPKVFHETKERDIFLDSLLSQELTHSDRGVIFIKQLLDQNVSLNSVDEWFTKDLLTTQPSSASRWDLYFMYTTSRPVAARFLLDLLDFITKSQHQRTSWYLNLLETMASSGGNFDEFDDNDLRILADRLWSLREFSASFEFTHALASCIDSDRSLARAVNRSILNQVLQVKDQSVPIQDLCLLVANLVVRPHFEFDYVLELLPSLFAEVLPCSIPHELFVLQTLGSLALNDRHDKTPINLPEVDTDGQSRFLRATTFLSYATRNFGPEVHLYILLATELLSTKVLHSASSNILCGLSHDDIDISHQRLAQGHHDSEEVLLAQILPDQSVDSETMLSLFWREKDPKPESYYRALVLLRLLCICRQRGSSSDLVESMFLRTLDNPYLGVVCSTAFCEELLTSKKATFQRNKWASDLSGPISEGDAVLILPRLLSLVPGEEELNVPIPRQRLILLVKRLLNSVKEYPDNDSLVAEVFVLLQRLLPRIKDEYGSFWDDIIELAQKSLCASTTTNQSIPLQYTALKLLSWLTSNVESNDDLSEFWHNRLKATQRMLAETFVRAADVHHDNQAITLCTLISSRMLRTVPISEVDEESRLRLPALIATSPEHIQLSAYSMQQRIVEEDRDAMIMSCALTKEYEEVPAALPAELLSIVLDCPLIDENDVYEVQNPLPTIKRGYCMAWTLIFRYFANSSLRMRVKLIEELHGLHLTESLLTFIFLVVHLEDDKPADISKLSRSSLAVDFLDGSGELLAYASHLYFLALTHIPALVRQWWIDCKDRHLTTAVETLTEKYYSSSLIQRDVELLQSDQSKLLLKDDKLSVRVTNGGRDVFTMYEIDDQKMEMAIRLPPNFPLRRVTVEGLQRIGVKDAQWRAWLLASQAVLTAQNGSILDAISLFQRNVSLHFEGVEDCNICFSILSVQDKSLPSKKCQTCKNLFHSSCLFKWFKSSSKSQCPLCRTSFAF